MTSRCVSAPPCAIAFMGLPFVVLVCEFLAAERQPPRRLLSPRSSAATKTHPFGQYHHIGAHRHPFAVMNGESLPIACQHTLTEEAPKISYVVSHLALLARVSLVSWRWVLQHLPSAFYILRSVDLIVNGILKEREMTTVTFYHSAV